MFNKAKTKLAALAFVLATSSLANAQISGGYNYQIRPRAFGDGYDTYSPNGSLIYQTRPRAFGDGWDVYNNSGRQIQQIRPRAFGDGWDVHTMPRYNGW
jgi:hypothetical protein